MEWLDNADSWLCPVCKIEVSIPTKYNYHCPSCGFIAERDKNKSNTPVDIGDTVWFNTYTPDGACIGIQPHKVTKIKTSVMVEGRYIDTELPMKLFNKTWFLTRKEAERSENIGKD